MHVVPLAVAKMIVQMYGKLEPEEKPAGGKGA